MSTTETTNWLKSPGPHKLDRRQGLGIFIIVAIFLTLWTSSVTSYTDQPKSVEPPAITSKTGITIQLKATSFSTSTENLGLQLKLRGIGQLLDAKGLLSESIAVHIQDADDVRVIRIAKGEPLGTRETAVQVDGDVTQYPFDKYLGEFTLQAEQVLTDGSEIPIAIAVGSKKADTGWYTKFAMTADASDQTTVKIVAMHREQFHIMFAVMMTLLLLLLACISVAVGFLCITNRRSSEPSVVSWLSGILIAMTLTRRMMPGDPPLGCLLDIALFSWALILGIIAIALAMFAWLRQSRASHETEDSAVS